MSNEKKRFVKIAQNGSGGYLVADIQYAIECLVPELELAEPGDSFVVKIVEMTQAELEALPEFDGF